MSIANEKTVLKLVMQIKEITKSYREIDVVAALVTLSAHMIIQNGNADASKIFYSMIDHLVNSDDISIH